MTPRPFLALCFCHVGCYSLAPQAARPEKIYFSMFMIDWPQNFSVPSFLDWVGIVISHVDVCLLFPNSRVPFPEKAPQSLFTWAMMNRAMSGWPEDSHPPPLLPGKLPDAEEERIHKLRGAWLLWAQEFTEQMVSLTKCTERERLPFHFPLFVHSFSYLFSSIALQFMP